MPHAINSTHATSGLAENLAANIVQILDMQIDYIVKYATHKPYAPFKECLFGY